MEDFNAKQSSDEFKQLMEQLRAENVALREENTALQQQRVELGQQLAAAETARAQAEAELSTLTDAAQVLQEDREQLRNKIAELQAAVDRLTNMLWGRRSEKRINSNQPTLFDLQLSDEDTRVRLLTRGALEDEDIAKLQRRASTQSRAGPLPGSVNSYVWLYTGLDGAAPYDKRWPTCAIIGSRCNATCTTRVCRSTTINRNGRSGLLSSAVATGHS